jgi:uncharacterized membrane protein
MKVITYLKYLRIENLIILFAFSFGSLYIAFTPPFEVPDSPNHLYRAYQFSQGIIRPITQNNTVGGFVPKSFDSVQQKMLKYRFNPYAKISKDDYKELSAIKLNKEEKVFVHFPNTALYSPISYFPQTIAVFIGVKLSINPINIIYLTRFFSLFFWLLILYTSLRFLPIQKMLFGVLILLPTSLFINSSISADMMTNGLSFLYLAIVMNIILTDRKFDAKLRILLLLLIVSIGLSKLVYIPIVLLTLLIPFAKFKSKKYFYLYFSLSCLLGGSSSLVWKKYIDSVYTPYFSYNEDFRDNVTLGYKADMNKQMEFIKNNKLKSIEVFGESYAREFTSNFSSYINIFGWNRFELSTWFTILAYLLIFFFAFTHSSDVYFLSVKQKLLLAVIIITSTLLIMLSQYLTWNQVGSEKLYPLMGRYFTPVYPMFFLLFTNNKIKIKKRNGLVVFLIYGVFSGSYSLYKMDVFFNSNTNHKLSWEYDFSTKSINELTNEKMDGDIKIDGNKTPIILDSSNSVYALKLSPENPFGYTVTIPNLKKGDKIEVSCWKNEEEIRFVFDDKPNSQYYVATYFDENIKKEGFEYVSSMYYCLDDFEFVKIYLYNPSGKEGLAKEFKIQYYKNY